MYSLLHRLWPLLLMALIGWSAQAQPTMQLSPRVSTVSLFTQKIAARSYAGKAFRLSVRIRVDTTGSGGADARVSVVANDAKRRMVGAFGLKQAATAATWQTYQVTGKLPKQTDTVYVSGICYLNGTFEFDDFVLEAQMQPGQWQQVPLRNADFEQPESPAAAGWPLGWQELGQTIGFRRAVVEAGPGQHLLRVQGLGVVRYGRNRRAGHYATVNGVKLYYETYGQGEPLLLLHGNGESIVSFSNQIGALAEHYRVIAVDTRGHGQSGTDARPYTYDLFADDMRALLDTLRLPAAHVVGWSDGGNTGLSLATRYPTRVRSLVTMGANLYANNTAVAPGTLREVRRARALCAVLWPFSAQFRRGYRLTTLLLKYPRMQPAQLRPIQAPVLVLAGEKDIILEAHTRLIGQSIAGAQVVILPGVTHYAPQEHRTLFNDTVLAFLRLVPAAR